MEKKTINYFILFSLINFINLKISGIEICNQTQFELIVSLSCQGNSLGKPFYRMDIGQTISLKKITNLENLWIGIKTQKDRMPIFKMKLFTNKNIYITNEGSFLTIKNEGGKYFGSKNIGMCQKPKVVEEPKEAKAAAVEGQNSEDDYSKCSEDSKSSESSSFEIVDCPIEFNEEN